MKHPDKFVQQMIEDERRKSLARQKVNTTVTLRPAKGEAFSAIGFGIAGIFGWLLSVLFVLWVVKTLWGLV